MDLEYLTSRHFLHPVKDFFGVPAGTRMPLSVTKESFVVQGQRTALDGTIRKTTTRRTEYLIRLTAPDRTVHLFHTDPDSIDLSPTPHRGPVGRHANAPTRQHTIQTFVEHFHLPLPKEIQHLAHETPPDHSLLELLETITLAALSPEP
jgi:hypothetical protein